MDDTPGLRPLKQAEIRELKARAQRLKAGIKVGRDGLSDGFIGALNEALRHQPLLKVKFDDFKEDKKALAPLMAEKSRSHLVTRVGNVVVLYRPGLTEKEAADSGLDG